MDDMETQLENELPGGELPEVVVRQQRRPSPVWLIPLAAVLFGAWLLVQFWLTQGETITVPFPEAEGIQPGVTEVRYKAVSVGKVRKVTLDENLNPLVTLVLSKEISQSLDCSGQFWVVRPRVRGTEISGLGTLFSGTYIGMTPKQVSNSPAAETTNSLCYQVLEDPPRIKPARPGREFILETDSMGSLDVGSPIFYKQLEVGEVIDYRLVEDTGRIELTVFINEPFYRFITANTRFWNASGFDLRVDTSGAEFHMESLSTLIAGGIAFETPPDENTDHAISADGTHFVLYRNYAGSRERHYANRLYYTLYFDGSLRGLSEGATVEYQGIRVGQVEKIKLYYDQDSNDLRTPVLISIEPERFADDIDLERAPTLIREMVEKGLRAQLRSGSILTDLLYVALVFDPNAEKGSISSGQFYDIFPVDNQPTENVAMAMSALSLELQETVKKVNRFLEQGKLDETVGNVNGVLEETRSTMSKAGAALTDAQRLIRQLDQKTVPGLSSDISRVAERLDTQTLPMLTRDVSRVAERLDTQTLPQLSRNLNVLTERLDKQTLPMLTRDVSRVAERLDTQTLPQLSRNLNVLTERLDRETLPQLADNMTRITGTVNNALQRTTVSAEKVTGAVGRISGDFAKTTEALNKTLVRLQNTMGHLDRLLARNSPTQYQLDQMMQEVTLMSRSLRTLAETLQKQPESVLRGKREQ